MPRFLIDENRKCRLNLIRTGVHSMFAIQRQQRPPQVSTQHVSPVIVLGENQLLARRSGTLIIIAAHSQQEPLRDLRMCWTFMQLLFKKFTRQTLFNTQFVQRLFGITFYTI